MVRFTLAVAISCAIGAFALPQPMPLQPDAAGDKNIGNGQGGQFITGQCLSDADCQSTCCARLGDIGICSGKAVQFDQGKNGCGFGGDGAGAPPRGGDGINRNEPGADRVGKGRGDQFITGQCFSDADCASTCCAPKGNSGTCAALAVAQAEGGPGCGFVQGS